MSYCKPNKSQDHSLALAISPHVQCTDEIQVFSHTLRAIINAACAIRHSSASTNPKDSMRSCHLSLLDYTRAQVVHPGPPSDIGPSALDWVLVGDDGTMDKPNDVLEKLDSQEVCFGRTHWGITVLQAIELFDAGPVWAWEQFPIDIDQSGLTKIISAAASPVLDSLSSGSAIRPSLKAEVNYGRLSLGDHVPFQGGQLHHRPLLKAAQREIDLSRHTAQQISRRIRRGDSQPGLLSTCFGPSLYIYGGQIHANAAARSPASLAKLPTSILGIRNKAICLSTLEGKGFWITHIRRPKIKTEVALCPKIPAVHGLLELGILSTDDVLSHNWPPPADFMFMPETFQEVWIEFEDDEDSNKTTAYVFLDFYNGAMSTDQCSHLIEAFDYVLSRESQVQAVVLMGGSYLSHSG
ncbi:hypothetical protein AC579_2470 [Pseudocercospora musae]|uniref:Formyl transferase C-terminal domain-containing protein n=1 Tax=Pseudocercospora musae TaxID=113226 RepID=A0A139I601_9PEZI|nr:hypothetical protein AC579_2470 [Pseudocercospora musae]